MNTLKIGDLLWHPMSLDILQFKVISIIQNENSVEYKIKSTSTIGICGIVQLIVFQTKFDYLLCSEYVDSDNDKYSNGLGDFIEGKYYTNKSQARLAYYKSIMYSLKENMDNKFRIYEESKKSYDKVKQIIDDIKNQTER